MKQAEGAEGNASKRRVASSFGDQSGTCSGTKSHSDCKGAKVRVGWVHPTAREKKLVIRYFKCLKFGHVAAECPKDILEKLCYRCGESGHLAAGCGKPYKCLAFKTTGKLYGHTMGDVTCAALRIARVSWSEMANLPSVNMLQINLDRSREA